MNAKIIKLPVINDLPRSINTSFKGTDFIVLFVSLLLIWCFAPGLILQFDNTAGSIDQSIWLLIILSLISFLLITALCWWLLHRAWSMMGLPSVSTMVSQFNSLTSWQQLGFYWASFVSLLLAALGCLIAIC